MDLGKVGPCSHKVDWSLSEGVCFHAALNIIMSFWFMCKSEYSFIRQTTVGFSRRTLPNGMVYEHLENLIILLP